MQARGRNLDAAGAQRRSLVLFGELSTGVAGRPVTAMVFAGWQATVAAVRLALAAGRSAEAVVPVGIDDRRERPNAKPGRRSCVLGAAALTPANPVEGRPGEVRG